MDWPSPSLVLYVLGAFVAGYGLSLVVRAARARRWKGTRATCPDCGRPWVPKGGEGSVSCSACGAHEPVASAIKAARVWIAAGVLTSIGGVAAFTLGLWVAESLAFDRGFGSPRPGIGPFVGGGIGVSLFGLYVAFLGWRGDRARGRRRCPKCWYLIDDAVGLQCSECGREARHEKELYKTRRRLRLALLGLVLIAVGQLGWMERRVRAGGWLAAVPTEVLIVGMPWLPAECLTGGLAGADEDWSLTGRLAGRWNPGSQSHMLNGAWSWHRPWAVSRAGGWARRATTCQEALERLSALEQMAAGSTRPPLSLTQPGAVVHAARLGLASVGSQTDPSVAPLLQRVYQNAWMPTALDEFELRSPDQRWEVIPALRQMVAEHQAELVAAATAPGSLNATSAMLMLGLGPGDPAVVDALLGVTEPVQGPRWGRRAGAMALSILAKEDGRARDRILEAMEGEDPARRRVAINACSRLIRESGNERVRASLVRRLADTDPVVAYQASEVLWYSQPSPDEVVAIFDALVGAAVADASLALPAGELLQTNYRIISQHRHDRLVELGQSESPGGRALFVLVALGNSDEVDFELAARAIELIDSGEPVANELPENYLTSLRRRVVPDPAASAP